MDNKEINTLGNNIKSIRVKLKLTQESLARKANVPYTTLTKIETSVIKSPSVFVIEKISKGLIVTIEELLK